MKKIIILMAIIAMNAGGVYLSADSLSKEAESPSHNEYLQYEEE